MEIMDVLQLSSGEFAKRLRAVTERDWTKPTPCDGWDVRALVHHVIGGNLMSTVLLRGGSRDDAIAVFRGDVIGPSAIESYNGSFRTMVDTMNRPGVIDRVVHHPAFDMPATQLRDFRIAEYALHGWDLARALGSDDTLNATLVEILWQQLEPMRDMIGGSGVFGSGPSGSLSDSSPLQMQLLDLCGRRP